MIGENEPSVLLEWRLKRRGRPVPAEEGVHRNLNYYTHVEVAALVHSLEYIGAEREDTHNSAAGSDM